MIVGRTDSGRSLSRLSPIRDKEFQAAICGVRNAQRSVSPHTAGVQRIPGRPNPYAQRSRLRRWRLADPGLRRHCAWFGQGSRFRRPAGQRGASFCWRSGARLTVAPAWLTRRLPRRARAIAAGAALSLAARVSAMVQFTGPGTVAIAAVRRLARPRQRIGCVAPRLGYGRAAPERRSADSGSPSAMRRCGKTTMTTLRHLCCRRIRGCG